MDSDVAKRNAVGPERRRGPFRAGERVQLTDVKGRKYTTHLTNEGYFQSTRGSFRHSELIGKPEGTVIDTASGHRLLALRPLVSDFVLSMPRGATVIYPKDAAQIVTMADIFPGARVFEAGLGSGALSLSLLGAISGSQSASYSGDCGDGLLISVERRPEFAEIAQANVESWFGEHPRCWKVEIGEAQQVLDALPEQDLDVVILDMLAPWEIVASAARAIRPGGVFLAYVATIPQLSRVVETLRASNNFTEPESLETMLRTWHVDGLAIRPDHRMVAHTGFLVTARRLAPGIEPLRATKRPAPGAEGEPAPWQSDDFDSAGLERTIAPHKLRKVRRDVAHRADVEATGSAAPGEHGAKIAAQLDAQARAKDLAHRERARAQRSSVGDGGDSCNGAGGE